MSELPHQKETTNDSVTLEKNESLAPEAQPPAAEERSERLVVWLQFPRRLALLLIAYGLALALIVALQEPLLGSMDWTGPGEKPDWTVSLRTGTPVAELIGERMPNTLMLLGAAILIAFILALIAVLIAALAHTLEAKAGPLGSVLKGLGRVWIFGQAAAPVFCLGLFAIYIFAVRLKLLPPGGVADLAGSGNLADRLPYLILPALILALFPAALTAQAVAREVTLPRAGTALRLWLTGLFKGLGVLPAQIGGLLSGAVLVEVVFAWPGVGNLMLNAAIGRDFPVALGVLSAFAGLVLAGRLVAELFRGLERLAAGSISFATVESTPWRKTARKIWVAVALALLLIPMWVIISSLTIDPDLTTQIDPQARLTAPSANHPWGADALGRDLRARVLRGGLVTVGMAAGVAIITLLPGGLLGALTGFLASRRRLWSESVADLVLLPADVLLFIPLVPAGMVMTLWWGPGSVTVILAAVVALLPRAVRFFQTLWLAAPEHRRRLTLGVAGLGSLFLGTLFAGLWLVSALDFLGIGVQPPTPSLGGIMGDAFSYIAVGPEGVLSSGLALWLCAFAGYTAADALIGFFYSKEAMVRLNE